MRFEHFDSFLDLAVFRIFRKLNRIVIQVICKDIDIVIVEGKV